MKEFLYKGWRRWISIPILFIFFFVVLSILFARLGAVIGFGWSTIVTFTLIPILVTTFSRNPRESKMLRAVGTLAIIVIGSTLATKTFLWIAGNGSSDISVQQEQVRTDSSAYIPGMNSADAYISLENEGFVCERDYLSESQMMMWQCDQRTGAYLYNLNIQGNDSDEIVVLKATAQHYLADDVDTAVRDFLGYVASVPYDGASPAQARAWVEENVGQNISTTFGGVKYELFSNARTRMLRITAE